MYLSEKKMPATHIIKKAALKLKRTLLQLRLRISNVILGKQIIN